ncbi:M48 family metallopeptidase [Streptomyces iconiensis]|uniref:DUF45 domain-containing protein n=1 Tax=Streptomyces iconiensis TaxID=1384038 RepID=A0ABT7A779_9ACTN|nr:YgjP-like metallopeptidase domain-containing protein [Streptomyces iconiensis]MDJ1137193.1 DUF45 domain-containing protein [Streptomyces iconiensis]
MSNSVTSAIASLPLPGEWSWEVVIRPRRKTLGIEIREEGDVLFAVPPDADPVAVADAVRSKLPRLAAEVTKRRRGGGQPVKELVGGESFAYLGRRHRLKLVPGDISGDRGAKVRLRHGWLELPRPATQREGAQRIGEWYARRGEEWASPRMGPLAARAGVEASGVSVRDLGGRWGACEPDGRIVLHWAVMQLHPTLLDLVLVHELAHLRIATHGPAFRRRMRLVLADLDDLERRFAQAEPKMWRGAVKG